jgi:hypothetical protein
MAELNEKVRARESYCFRRKQREVTERPGIITLIQVNIRCM